MHCKDCTHSSLIEDRPTLLNCGLAQDFNNHRDACGIFEPAHDPDLPLDRMFGWDYEGYRAGVYVGPEFGCIHFSHKDLK